jgi:hypothetical protein
MQSVVLEDSIAFRLRHIERIVVLIAESRGASFFKCPGFWLNHYNVFKVVRRESCDPQAADTAACVISLTPTREAGYAYLAPAMTAVPLILPAARV